MEHKPQKGANYSLFTPCRLVKRIDNDAFLAGVVGGGTHCITSASGRCSIGCCHKFPACCVMHHHQLRLPAKQKWSISVLTQI